MPTPEQPQSDFDGCNECDVIEGCKHNTGGGLDVQPEMNKAFAKITGEIGVVDGMNPGERSYQLQVRAEVEHPTAGKIVIASLAANMMTLDIGERFIGEFRKVAFNAIATQRAREKEQAERRVDVVTQLPRVLRRAK